MEHKVQANGTFGGFLQNNRRARESWDCIWLPVARRCLRLAQSFQTEQWCCPTLGAVQMGSCVEK